MGKITDEDIKRNIKNVINNKPLDIPLNMLGYEFKRYIYNKHYNNTYSKKYYLKNKEKILNYKKLYYQKNKEKIKLYNKEYYQKNKC